ncbi:MAG: carbohydrate ABC transporter permease [Anaerolineae bacterium]|nr:carbohydrate ABC transporter permease [Anaerolineae bacterium]
MGETVLPRTVVMSRRRWRPAAMRRTLGRVLAYSALFAGAFIFLIPLAWLISTSLGTAADAVRVPHVWLPWPLRFENFPNALSRAPFHIYLRNTLIVTGLAVTGTLLSTSLVAFGFARMRFRGRDLLFLILLSTMMIPGQVLLVPMFILFKTLGWYDTLLPLIVPQWFGTNAFGIFLLRQFFMTIPLDLDDAARIDGAHTLQVWWRILLPLSRPVLTTMGVLSFLFNWNDFIGPLIFIRSPGKQTFALALAALPSQYYTNYHEAMAATFAFMLPCVILFFFAQRYLLKGLALTGLGGK